MGVSENVVYPIVPNGFADHYPYEMAISLGIYPIFRQTHIVFHSFCSRLWGQPKKTQPCFSRQVNRHLLKDLISRGLYNEAIRIDPHLFPIHPWGAKNISLGK